jgi:hypothetical protein
MLYVACCMLYVACCVLHVPVCACTMRPVGRIYWGDRSCSGDFDQWTAVNVSGANCTDIACSAMSDDDTAATHDSSIVTFCSS